MSSNIDQLEVRVCSGAKCAPGLGSSPGAFGSWLEGQSSNWPILALSALVTALLFGALLIWVTPGYETNDDAGLQLIASGFYDGHPSEHLVFTSVIIGWPLRLLYTQWPNWNWYMSYLVTVQYASMTAVCFVLLTGRRRWSTLGLFVGFFLLVQIRMLVDLQFTTTSFFAGATGILLLLDGLTLGGRGSWTLAAVGLGFIALAAMIREAVVPMLAVLASPFLVERIKLIGWRRFLGALFAAAALVLALASADRRYYRLDPAWSEYREYNDLRGQIHGTPLTNSISQAAASIGWSKNDGEMFRSFYFAEPEVYSSTQKMRLLVSRLHTASPRPKLDLLARQFTRCFFLPNAFPHDSAFFMKLALLNGVLCLLFAGAYLPRYFITLLASYGLFVLLSIYLRTTARLPERVAFTMPLLMNLVCLYWFTRPEAPGPVIDKPGFVNRVLPTFTRPRTVKWLRRACLALCAVLYLPSLFHFSQGWYYGDLANRRLRVASRTIFQPLSRLTPPGQKPLLIAMPTDSLLEMCLAYLPASDPPFYLVPNGWLTHSPIFQEVLHQHHLEPYSLSLLDRPGVFFRMEPSWQPLLETFYGEHYDCHLRFESALHADPGLQDGNCWSHLYSARRKDGREARLEVP